MLVTQNNSSVPPAGGRATVSNGLAWLCLLVALLFPMSMLLYAGILLVRGGLEHPLIFVYNALDYYGVPVLLLAIVLGHLSQVAAIRLPSPPAKRRLARIGLWIGYLSLVFILAAFAVALEVEVSR
jgi:hypothetical protein